MSYWHPLAKCLLPAPLVSNFRTRYVIGIQLDELIITLIGQASDFNDALFTTDWLDLSLENKKLLLLIMMGSSRKVNIRAGGTYELNLALFAQVK